jgi:hypothetical protein
LLGLGGAGAATAAGATAAATTTAGALQTLATIATIGGTLYSGITGMQAGREQARAIEAQAVTERALTATEDQRRRAKFATGIAQQRADITARGVDLSSPTAVFLGQTAAQELSFDSQSVRSTGAARQAELSANARASRASATASMIRGTVGAASEFLTAAPDVWPGLLRERQLA